LPEAALNLMLPGNPRYQPKSLQGIFGYDHLVGSMIEVEIQHLLALAAIDVIPDRLVACQEPKIRGDLCAITTTMVDERERRTKHDVRALVELIRERLAPELAPFVHLGLTSYDVIDTGRVMQYRTAYSTVIRPLCLRLIGAWANLVEREADTPQIGRTHGQHAIPITVGFWLGTVLDRFMNAFGELHRAYCHLTGKITGAVGASNVITLLGWDDAARAIGVASYEELLLGRLDVQPATSSTQICPPEAIANFLFHCVQLSLVIEQLATDCRHLMRTEIGEVMEEFAVGQVGSSTMAHKRNPATFENEDGFATIQRGLFGMVLETMVSEHQRDLTGSVVMRNWPVIVVNLVYQLERLLGQPTSTSRPFIERIVVNRERCLRNLEMQSAVYTAEPFYVLLQLYGYEGDAHDLVNHTLVPGVAGTELSIVDLAASMAAEEPDSMLGRAWSAIPGEKLAALRDPVHYCGKSVQVARDVVERARQFVNDF